MHRLRDTVHSLRQHVSLVDQPTSGLVSHLIEEQLLASEHGFEVFEAGVFEIRQVVPWNQHFRQKPRSNCFVRGVAKFGYGTNTSPKPRSEFMQHLNTLPQRQQDDEILLVGYQYGAVARKRDSR
jgi:hypothetical protein